MDTYIHTPSLFRRGHHGFAAGADGGCPYDPTDPMYPKKDARAAPGGSPLTVGGGGRVRRLLLVAAPEVAPAAATAVAEVAVATVVGGTAVAEGDGAGHQGLCSYLLLFHLGFDICLHCFTLF